jgi:hypothetical protein
VRAHIGDYVFWTMFAIGVITLAVMFVHAR